MSVVTLWGGDVRPRLEVFYPARPLICLCVPSTPPSLVVTGIECPAILPLGCGESVHSSTPLTPPASPAFLFTPRSGAPWAQLQLKVIGIPGPCSSHYFQSRVSSFYGPHKTSLLVT